MDWSQILNGVGLGGLTGQAPSAGLQQLTGQPQGGGPADAQHGMIPGYVPKILKAIQARKRYKMAQEWNQQAADQARNDASDYINSNDFGLPQAQMPLGGGNGGWDY